MRAVLIILCVGVLSACVTTQPTYMANGKVGHHITCGGALFSQADCYKKAGDICGHNGYTIIAANKEASPYIYGNSAGQIINRDLIIECNGAG